MIVKVGTGWQTLIADLSMILFMLTASAFARQDRVAHATPVVAAPRAAPRTEPVAVWIAGEGAPPLRAWLAQQPHDPRQQVTITASYAPGAMAEALDQAQTLAREAGDARVVVEPGLPGEGNNLRVVVGYDAPEARLARSLRSSAQNTPVKDRP
ncbi:hypothetical protein HNO88_001446 [Novosphingobium chloroacetimidivorans]|uniref:Uncharacterized protein n=1 Tax=Novosphingobium chloroacetimidivorans TaxID=1428314 RepID=A0A7W7K8D1_9SPHN|nr:hypothetical protein [Novosphingobium chloroacetimidivorans]MBB4858132.1 hypothetical protein [Novosphingobium chloroacetimidivorans]